MDKHVIIATALVLPVMAFHIPISSFHHIPSRTTNLPYNSIHNHNAHKTIHSPSPLSKHARTRTKLYSETQSNDNNSNNDDEQTQTLYEILNCPPDATRDQLKKNYITLVRQSHPDALLSNGSSPTADSEEQFQRITAAWKTLANPLERKRYDRELRAQEFTQNVEDVVGNIATTAGPQFMRAFDNVAIPFLRRSAATTVAGFTAVTKDIQNYSDKRSAAGLNVGDQEAAGAEQQRTNNEAAAAKNGESLGLGSILSNAVQASQKAGKAIDRLELNEKSRDLFEQAQKEAREATRLRDKLDKVMRKRVQLLLHTPDAKLSSLEAQIILDSFNIKDEVTMLDTVRLRKTVTQEIEWLQPLEQEVKQKQEYAEQLEFDIERKSSAFEQAQVNAAAAVQAEERARKALEDAIALVDSTRVDVENTDNSLRKAVDDKTNNLAELDRVKWNMERQQERVRLALRRKEQALDSNVPSPVLIPIDEDGGAEGEMVNPEDELEMEMELGEDVKIKGDFDKEAAEAAKVQIRELLKKERDLKARSAKVQAKAERLEISAQKVLDRANQLEEDEEEAYKALEEGLQLAKKAAESGYGKYGENKVGEL
jgi:curved DNA-binding protein CbpA